MRASCRWSRTGGVSVLAPHEFGSVAWSADRARVHFADGYAVDTRLLVAADGLRSPVRAAAGIVASPQPYGQTAVVANFATERAHHGRAWQWFRQDGGILAWLPLPGTADVDGVVRADPPGRRVARLAPGRPGDPRRRGRRPRTRLAALPDARSAGFRCPRCASRPSSRIAWRWSAMPPTASTRWPAKASTSGSATRKRSPRCCARAAPSPTRQRPFCWNATRGGVPNPYVPCTRSPTVSPASSALAMPQCAPRATRGSRRSIACP